MTTIKPIHPFPARMAPEIALSEAAMLPIGSLILDPMTGSGTVPRVVAEQGHRCIGFDLDPLAVLMAKVWTSPLDPDDVVRSGEVVAETAQTMVSDEIRLPWIDDDTETRHYVDFWFAETQKADLRRLSHLLFGMTGPASDALRIALSRLIITKDRGASLARDVSHSRPHRVRLASDYPVITEFGRSVRWLAERLRSQPPPGNVFIASGDARSLAGVVDGSVDAVITSPPYLNAIDYMRGHRLALVWLGYRVADLRIVRQESIGAERGPDPDGDTNLALRIRERLEGTDQLPGRILRMIERYVDDMSAMLSELRRVLRPGGKAVLVIGNSCVRGVFVENALAIELIARELGFEVTQRRERQLPLNRRYLPPPTGPRTSSLSKRMRTETILTLLHP